MRGMSEDIHRTVGHQSWPSQAVYRIHASRSKTSNSTQGFLHIYPLGFFRPRDFEYSQTNIQ
jgi:hypothetical protein